MGKTQLELRFSPSHVAVETLFVLRPVQNNDMGLGFFAAFETSVHRRSANFGPIISVKWDRLTLTLNPFLEQTFGLPTGAPLTSEGRSSD